MYTHARAYKQKQRREEARRSAERRSRALEELQVPLKPDDAIIFADVDEVMRRLMRALAMPEPPPYDAEADPLLRAAVAPRPGEPDAPWRIERQRRRGVSI